MSGLFRLLARQALGLTSPVRTVARLPFAAAPEIAEEPVLLAPGVPPGPPPSPAPPPEKRAPAGGTPGAREPHNRLVRPRVGVEDRGNGPREPTPAVPVPREVGLPALAGAAGGEAPERATAASPLVGVPGGRAGRPAPTPAPPGPAHDLHGTVQAPIEVPWEPLLPPRPAEPFVVAPAGPQRGGGRAPAGASVTGRSGPVEEVTEVHVSIGRIEVTAARQAPSTTERRSQAERRGMSLDDYLARRQGAGT